MTDQNSSPRVRSGPAKSNSLRRKTPTANEKLLAKARQRASELALGHYEMSEAVAIIKSLTNALGKAERKIANPEPRSLEVEGNRGGSFVTLIEESREGMVRLEVGESCVVTVQESISVAALAIILTAAKDRGLQKVVDDYLAIGGGSPVVKIDRDVEAPKQKRKSQ